MFMNTKSTGYGEDAGWKARYRLSTLYFGPHKRSLNTNTRDEKKEEEREKSMWRGRRK